jgi:hypothetical protein
MKIIIIFLTVLINLSVHANESSHLDAAKKIYEVSIGAFNQSQAMQYAQIFAPDGTIERQTAIATAFLEVLNSEEFAMEYSKVIASIFSEEECNKLSSILTDPVLAKFRDNRATYTQQMMVLAQEMLMKKIKS